MHGAEPLGPRRRSSEPRQSRRRRPEATRARSSSCGGTEIATPEATVTLKTYSVKISASYDHLPIAQMADLLNTAQKRTVLGHPAVLYSDRTIAIAIWRQDSVVPDDAPLLSVAEKVLPTIPGWGNG